MKKILSLFCSCLIITAAIAQEEHFKSENGKYVLTIAGASHLAELPLKCIQQEFPYKTGVVFTNAGLVKNPKNYHPAFYGCFDWHSSVHGHWMLVRLLKLFPQMPQADSIRNILRQQLTWNNIQGEINIFNDKNNKSFERTYGWAWILQLQKELLQWNDTLGKQLAANVQPLADMFSGLYRDYLHKLVYPIRVGEHSNLAFGLRLAWDYANTRKDDSLKTSIRQAALRFYRNDVNCPLSWEPGGSDFLSPCLEEADLMWRILPEQEYEIWLQKFLPQLSNPAFKLAVGEVKDRTDGKLVHLDGLNFSRAWSLYGIAAHVKKNRQRLHGLANIHLKAALPHVASGDYMGEHWLASFAVYALTVMNK
jgi:hypothetical protein